MNNWYNHLNHVSKIFLIFLHLVKNPALPTPPNENSASPVRFWIDACFISSLLIALYLEVESGVLFVHLHCVLHFLSKHLALIMFLPHSWRHIYWNFMSSFLLTNIQRHRFYFTPLKIVCPSALSRSNITAFIIPDDLNIDIDNSPNKHDYILPFIIISRCKSFIISFQAQCPLVTTFYFPSLHAQNPNSNNQT